MKDNTNNMMDVTWLYKSFGDNSGIFFSYFSQKTTVTEALLMRLTTCFYGELEKKIMLE